MLLVLVVAAAKLAGALATRVRQPAVFGEILIGVVLGPTVLDVLGWPMFMPAAGTESAALLPFVRDLASVGVLLLMFVAGLETDLDQMRHVGSVAFWSAAGGVLLPLAGGAMTAVAFGLPLLWEGIFVGTILTATSVSISAQTLMELGALRSREGSTILAAAVIDDVMGIVVLSLVVALAGAGATGRPNGWAFLVVLLRLLAFFAAAIAARRFLPAVLKWADALPVSQALLATVLVIAFLYGWAAEYVGGVAAITGTYLAGVLIAQTEFKTTIDRGVHPLTYSMFVPLFFISIGLQTNARELGPRAAFTVALLVVAVVAKAVGCGVFARLFGFSTTQAVRVGVGMIPRGEVELIIAGYGLANGIIGSDVFSAAVTMVLATTMVAPPLVRLAFPRHAFVPSMVEETIAGPPEEGEARA